MANKGRKAKLGAIKPDAVQTDFSLLTKDDIYYFNEGTHFRLYNKLGAHPLTHDGVAGTYFAVWAPNAAQVCVMGDFNGWDKASHPLCPRAHSGLWERFIGGVRRGAHYKYYIISNHHGHCVDKADPFAFYAEIPRKTASIVWDLDYQWGDAAWMRQRIKNNALDAPMTIYEAHIGSWMRVPEDGNRALTYRELAESMPSYLKRICYTHVEFMPVMEHPYGGSWGYQSTGYFGPTSRFGSPQDFMYLVDKLHQQDIGVILDWVPSHFATDSHGLGYFDGTHLYEHSDPQKGFHPDWKSFIFNYGRHEVRCFLISSALFWLDKYHIDGLRVDAVASMLYLDYSRKQGEWIPNEFGGNENLEAISLLRRFNAEVYKQYPDVQTIAEESTAWPMVSRPLYVGGLGFGMKWDMGWMHDTLKYMALDPIYRKYHHNKLTFRLLYAFQENFVLSLSHDEVVHEKRSLIAKMPGNDWEKFANLRALYGYMHAQPGKKLMFMGGEFGQWNEWSHDGSLDWHLARHGMHAGLQKWVTDLNEAHRLEPALHELDFSPDGFEWLDCSDWQQSIISLLRKPKTGKSKILVVCNLTPLLRRDYRIGVPHGGHWKELLNSDAAQYGGSGHGNLGGFAADQIPVHNREYSLNLVLPPLSVMFFKSEA